MQNKAIIICVISITMMLSSCSVLNPESDIVNSVDSIPKMAASEVSTVMVKAEELDSCQLEVPSNATILFFEGKTVLYYIDRFNGENPELSDLTIFEYDITDGMNREITTISKVGLMTGSVTVIGEEMYLPYSTNDVNYLLSIDLSSGETDLIKKWSTYPPMAFVYNLANKLIVFGPDMQEDKTVYSISEIKLDTKEEKILINKAYENESGDLIPCLCTDEESIYTFEITASNKSESYSVVRYNQNGEAISSYPLNFSVYGEDNLKIDNNEDGVFNIFKKGEFLFFNTINGRMFVYKLENASLSPVKVPKSFYDVIPAGYTLVKDLHNRSNHVLLTNSFEGNNVLFEFNTLDESFKSIEFKDEGRYEFFRNSEGAIITKHTNAEKPDDIQYVLYDSF